MTLHEGLVVIGKAIVDGTSVVLFALLGQVLHPKRFSGLISADPSIAVAGFIITVVDKGDHEATLSAIGMMFGAVGFVVFALCVRMFLVRYNAEVTSSRACIERAVVAIGGYFVILR
ncbi:MAG TPA: DUF3147 family protein [Acidimicrobiales bacterium]|nr:DUF3147 family protein [Acidimicrobiales bacterium]